MTAPSPSPAFCLRRPTGPALMALQADVLDGLRARMPNGYSQAELVACYGETAPTRGRGTAQ